MIPDGFVPIEDLIDFGEDDPVTLSQADEPVTLSLAVPRDAGGLGELARSLAKFATTIENRKPQVIHIHVPKQEPPTLNVTVPTPEVTVNVPPQEPVSMTKEIKRDSNGLITSVTERPARK